MKEAPARPSLVALHALVERSLRAHLFVASSADMPRADLQQDVLGDVGTTSSPARVATRAGRPRLDDLAGADRGSV